MEQIIYSFRTDKKFTNKAKKESKRLGLCTSVFIRQAILEKVKIRIKLKILEKDCLSGGYKHGSNVMSYPRVLPEVLNPYTNTKIKL